MPFYYFWYLIKHPITEVSILDSPQLTLVSLKERSQVAPAKKIKVSGEIAWILTCFLMDVYPSTPMITSLLTSNLGWIYHDKSWENSNSELKIKGTCDGHQTRKNDFMCVWTRTLTPMSKKVGVYSLLLFHEKLANDSLQLQPRSLTRSSDMLSNSVVCRLKTFAVGHLW